MGRAVSEAAAVLFAENRYTELPPPARPRRGDDRSPGRVLAPPHPGGARASPARTGPAWPDCSASSTAVAATRGATRPAPTWRTTPSAPSSSVPTASVWRSTRSRPGSSTPSRPPPLSSATTRRPSTSWPGRPASSSFRTSCFSGSWAGGGSVQACSLGNPGRPTHNGPRDRPTNAVVETLIAPRRGRPAGWTKER